MTIHTLMMRDVIKFNGDDFMKSYPIFDEAHREQLNQMIKDEYWLMEIAHETDSIFMHRFKTIMNREMPTFNELYRVAQREIDPFITMSLKTNTKSETDTTRQTTTQTDTETTSNTDATNDVTRDETNNTTGESHNLGYVFPATQIQQRKDYATSGGDSDSTTNVTSDANETSTANTVSADSGSSTGTGNETANATDTGLSVTEGYQGLPGDLLRNYRENILNVDAMVVNMLSRLFIGIWATNAPLI